MHDHRKGNVWLHCLLLLKGEFLLHIFFFYCWKVNIFGSWIDSWTHRINHYKINMIAKMLLDREVFCQSNCKRVIRWRGGKGREAENGQNGSILWRHIMAEWPRSAAPLCLTLMESYIGHLWELIWPSPGGNQSKVQSAHWTDASPYQEREKDW